MGIGIAVCTPAENNVAIFNKSSPPSLLIRKNHVLVDATQATNSVNSMLTDINYKAKLVLGHCWVLYIGVESWISIHHQPAVKRQMPVLEHVLPESTTCFIRCVQLSALARGNHTLKQKLQKWTEKHTTG